MANLHRTSTNLEAREVKDNGSKMLDINLSFNFVSDGDYSEYLNEDGSINQEKLFVQFLYVLNAAEEVEI